MGAAACGGKGFKGNGKGKWREAKRRRELQTAIQPSVLRPPHPLNHTAFAPQCANQTPGEQAPHKLLWNVSCRHTPIVDPATQGMPP